MRLHTVALLGLLAAAPAGAQSNQDAEPPLVQALAGSLAGNKNQTTSSRKGVSGETQEQHDHYINKNVENKTGTDSTVVKNNNGD